MPDKNDDIRVLSGESGTNSHVCFEYGRPRRKHPPLRYAYTESPEGSLTIFFGNESVTLTGKIKKHECFVACEIQNKSEKLKDFEKAYNLNNPTYSVILDTDGANEFRIEKQADGFLYIRIVGEID